METVIQWLISHFETLVLSYWLILIPILATAIAGLMLLGLCFFTISLYHDQKQSVQSPLPNFHKQSK